MILLAVIILCISSYYLHRSLCSLQLHGPAEVPNILYYLSSLLNEEESFHPNAIKL